MIKCRADLQPRKSSEAPSGADDNNIRQKTGKILIDKMTGIEFVLAPTGTFNMGDNLGGGNSNELPVHSVTLSAYQISKYVMRS